MPTKTKNKLTEAKELRNEAKSLGVDGYDSMSRAELRDAITKAKAPKRTKATAAKRGNPKVSKAEAEEFARKRATAKRGGRSTAKKSAAKATSKAKPKSKASKPAAKRATKATAPVNPDNPFRKGSDLHIIAPLLLKGGKRRTLATALSKKIELHPYSAKSEEEVDLTDFDKRLLLAAGTMRRRFGFEEVRDGRGLDGSIKVVPGKAKAKSNGRAGSKSKAKR